MCPSPTEILVNSRPCTMAPVTDAAPQQSTPSSFANAPQVVDPPALISVKSGPAAEGVAVSADESTFPAGMTGPGVDAAPARFTDTAIERVTVSAVAMS